MEGNGTDTKIGQLTADAIRASGLKVADELRALVKQMREGGVMIEAQAEDCAQAVIEATSAIADNVTAYIGSCKDASESVKQHRMTLKVPGILASSGLANAVEQAEGA